MLHVMGMSHLISILRAYSNDYTVTIRDLTYVDERLRPQSAGVLNNPSRPSRQLQHFILPVGMPSFPVTLAADGYRVDVPDEYVRAWEPMKRSCEAHGERNVLFCAMRGHEELVAGIPKCRVPFDFVVSNRPEIPVVPDCQILPVGIVREHLISTWATSAVAVYLGLRQVMPNTRLIHIFPPPPKRDDRFFYEHYFGQMAEKQRLADCPYGVNAAPLRLKYSLLYRAVLREGLSQLGIGWIDPPVESMDADGYLRSEYYLDAAHANPAYGELVIRQMEALQQTVSPN